ncbi:uncharacterized protein [Lolium perenne]|uniref:uncharacterized protein n=1 Tax=Lolium perenne TaxID=4522 RepID=UPI0021F638FA|nr:uncharacterized protein LOC127342097 [Lolium perenne]
MAAATAPSSSSSSDSPPMAPWTLLNRVALIWDDAETEDREEAAVKLSWSPTLSRLWVARSIHPDRDNFDRHPYIAAHDARGLLLHVSSPPGIGLNLDPNPAGLFVVLPLSAFVPGVTAEFFMATDAAVRVPERLDVPDVWSIKSVGLLSRVGADGVEYVIAELQSVNDADEIANLLRFRLGSAAWVQDKVNCIGFNPSCIDQVISHQGKLWWVDLRKGLIVCDPFQIHPVLVVLDLPNGVTRRQEDESECDDIAKKRYVTVSAGILRFLQVTGDSGIAKTAVMMWTLVSDPDTLSPSWQPEFMIDTGKIWPCEIPALAIVHPDNPELVYFFVQGKLVSVDISQNTHLNVFNNLSHFNLLGAWHGEVAPPPLSWRYLIAWKNSNSEECHPWTAFVREQGMSSFCEYEDEVSASEGHKRRSYLGKLCRQGVKAGKLFASEFGVGVTSLGSKLLYLNEEITVAKSFFKHVGEFKCTGEGYVATTARNSAKASKGVSKVLGGAASALSYGGKACRSAGFTLQTLHPSAQTGMCIVEEKTLNSLQEAKDVIKEWKDSKDPVSVDVPRLMETGTAIEIMELFKECGALVLVENATILREKAGHVLDDDWHMV